MEKKSPRTQLIRDKPAPIIPKMGRIPFPFRMAKPTINPIAMGINPI